MQESVVMGFDYGATRIGVSLGNDLTQSARALSVIDARTNRAKWAGIGALIEAWQPEILIVGIPCHPDGAAHAVTFRAMRFARQLQERYRKRVYTVDERYSSVVVDDGSGAIIDDAAAAVILQQWFDEGKPQRLPVERL